MDVVQQTLGYPEPAVRREPVEKSWLRSIDPEIPARLTAALIRGDEIVVLSGPMHLMRARAETLAATVPLLREAGFAIATIAAPLSLSVLYDAISETLTDPANQRRPLIVIIEQAENLIEPAIRRLIALVALRRDDRPVLRFLIAGTPALWPAMRAAGLGGLGSDSARHVRLGVWHMVVKRPPEVRFQTEPKIRIGGPGAWAVFLGLAAAAAFSAGLAALGRHSAAIPVTIASSAGAARAGTQPRPPPTGAGESLRPTAGPTSPRVASLRTDGPRIASLRTASQGATPAAAVPPPVAATWSDITMHVTIRYASGDAGAARRAGAVVSELRKQGILADGPLASRQPGAGSSLSYGFAQDRADAEIVARMVLPEAGKAQLRPSRSDAMRRPGEISVFIGSDEEPDRNSPS